MIDRTGRIKLILVFLGTFILSIIISLAVLNATRKPLYNIETSIEISSENDFVYALKTQYVSGIWATGTISLAPIKIDELKSSFGKIIKTSEKYTQHREYVCDKYKTDSKGNKTNTCESGHWKTWYEWDYYKKKVIYNPSIIFMGKEFHSSVIKISDAFSKRLRLNKDTIEEKFLKNVNANYLYEKSPVSISEGDIRHYYHIVPLEFVGNMYIKSTGQGYLNENDLNCGCEIVSQTKSSKINFIKKSRWFWEYIGWWLFPVVAGIISVIYFYNND